MATGNEQRRQVISLKELVEKALAKHELTVRNNDISIDMILEKSMSSVDPEQMLAVFENLISNAIKHSPNSGTINIWLKEANTNQIRFTIKDQGKGVPSGQEKAIFEPFFVGKQSSKMTLRGTGLGLAIAKQYIDAHNGDIEILRTSIGATFQVTLPKSPSYRIGH